MAGRLVAPVLALALLPAAGAAQDGAAAWRFKWLGANGYRMTGAMALEPGRETAPIVEAEDVSCFVIEGFHDGAPIGRWMLGDLHEETTWILTFFPREDAFAVSGEHGSMPQGWNMNGAGNDCGAGGFGFNLGNIGQDLCVDNALRRESRVGSYRPFEAVRDDDVTFPPGACKGPPVIG